MAGQAAGKLPLRFSQDASQKMGERGIRLTEAQFEKLLGAVEEAAAKGSQRSLILMEGLAFVVDVQNRTVVDLADRNRLGDLASMRIDSVVEAKS